MTTHKHFVKAVHDDAAVIRYADMIRHGQVEPDTTEYKYICKIHSEYEGIIELLKSKGAIMTPIRGVYMPSYGKRYITKALDIGTIVASQRCVYLDDDNFGDYVIERYKEFRACTQIIGYAIAIDIDKLTANCGEVKYCLGVSICAPDDFVNFNKEIGIVLAWYDLFDINTSNRYPVEELIGHNSLVKYGKKSWYYMPLTLGEQIKEFEHRCDRYFAYKFVETEAEESPHSGEPSTEEINK